MELPNLLFPLATISSLVTATQLISLRWLCMLYISSTLTQAQDRTFFTVTSFAWHVPEELTYLAREGIRVRSRLAGDEVLLGHRAREMIGSFSSS